MTRTATVAFGILFFSGIGLAGVASAQAVDAPTRFIQVANSYNLEIGRASCRERV